ncbi:nucleotidyltransferase family protein [Candidatus Woesearchaeota archaeon]|nr:nucleotidyltransferase family protein [Candidatus Woesearchaeota archaeon]
MKAVILAAGYATRLYPLTKNTPKPLLNIRGKPILEYILDKLEEVKEVDEVFIITNRKFFMNFLKWHSGFKYKKKITIVNDQTDSNENRLGSLGDIKFVIENMKITDDLMVIAGDNLFEFSIKPMMELFKKRKSAIVALYDVKDMELATLYGIVTVDKNGKIVDFEEKPKNPKSTLASTGVYIYPKATARKLIEFSKSHDADKAGNFLEWLYKKEGIYCHITSKRWFDIGSLEQLKHADKEFAG